MLPEYGIQPLHLTVYGGGYPEVARTLLEAGAAVNAAESNGRTTLHHAAIRNAHRLVNVLLEYHCNLNPIRLVTARRCPPFPEPPFWIKVKVRQFRLYIRVRVSYMVSASLRINEDPRT